ncbi:MAG TPA: thiamine pyrophosphate-dependent enzyme [Lentzea sp.]
MVALVGDGTYLFGVPASAHWVARRYDLPTLTVIYDNRGWKSSKLFTLGFYPHGVAAKHNDFGISFTREADLPGIARAVSGTWARTVSHPEELPTALQKNDASFGTPSPTNKVQYKRNGGSKGVDERRARPGKITKRGLPQL